MCKRLLVCLVVTLLLPSATATIMRLDFSGFVHAPVGGEGGPVLGEYSGYFLLDSSVPDTSGQPNYGRYEEAFVGGSINWNGTSFHFPAGAAAIAVVNNSSVLGDFFGIELSGSGEPGSPLFSFHLSDSTQTVFSNDSFPAVLTLENFDPVELGFYNGSGIAAIIDLELFQGTFESISYAAIPLPDALFLLVSAISGLAIVPRR